MARKSDVERHTIDNENVGHEHCKSCGACLIAGGVHRCVTTIDPEVLEVFRMDMRPGDVRKREPNGFQLVKF